MADEKKTIKAIEVLEEIVAGARPANTEVMRAAVALSYLRQELTHTGAKVAAHIINGTTLE